MPLKYREQGPKTLLDSIQEQIEDATGLPIEKLYLRWNFNGDLHIVCRHNSVRLRSLKVLSNLLSTKDIRISSEPSWADGDSLYGISDTPSARTTITCSNVVLPKEWS